MSDAGGLLVRLLAFEAARPGARLTRLQILHERIDRYRAASYHLSAVFRDARGNESVCVLEEWRGDVARVDAAHWDEVHRWAEREAAAREVPFETHLSGD